MSSKRTFEPIIPPKEDARFPPLKAMAEENWREYQPKLVSELEKNGTLQKNLDSAVSLAIISLQQSEARGLSPDQGRELAYERACYSRATTRTSKSRLGKSCQEASPSRVVSSIPPL
jgi:hypothetical protein